MEENSVSGFSTNLALVVDIGQGSCSWNSELKCWKTAKTKTRSCNCHCHTKTITK